MSNKPDALVFFDLDGTLLTSQVLVADSTIAAINQLKANNITPILATGRTVCEVDSIMQTTGIGSIVAMNGQAVFYQGESIFANNLDNKLIDKVLAFSRQQTGIPLAFYNDQLMRISENSDAAVTLYHYLRQPLPPVDENIHYQVSIQMLLLICQSGEEVYRQQFPELTFVRNTPYCVDVFNHGGSKAFGIQKLIENKGFEGIPTYAFGDGPNDIEMFEQVDHPIAMANGIASLKQLAEFITDDNDHDGIAKGLKQAGLI